MKPQPPALEAIDLVHRYGAVLALDHVSLTVPVGEFLTILGPSGSGKTTLLRMIGGFETPTSAAALAIGGVDVRGLPPNHRPVATVFQHYALFPHMSVGENVEYGLKVRNVPPVTRRQRAEAALALVRLVGKADRRITQLSGGERQRVAFARALVTEPNILLLDEPMGALDEKLRREMQVEVRALQKQVGSTFIQVTHSQDEALTMSDRIAVMNRGRIEQLGTPAEIFDSPATAFVAAFMGLSNLIDGRIVGRGEGLVEIACGEQMLRGRWTGTTPPDVGDSAFFAVHPQKLRPAGPLHTDAPANRFSGTVRARLYRGAQTELTVETELGPLAASVGGEISDTGSISLVAAAQDCAIGPREGVA